MEWQVTGTDLVGEALMPSSYQAVATYSAKASYNAATGYVTTAEYVGDISHEGIESITYVLTYLGEPASKSAAVDMIGGIGNFFATNWPFLLAGGILLMRNRKEAKHLEEENELEEESEDEQEALHQ